MTEINGDRLSQTVCLLCGNHECMITFTINYNQLVFLEYKIYSNVIFKSILIINIHLIVVLLYVNYILYITYNNYFLVNK